jgi:hypothetical protein
MKRLRKRLVVILYYMLQYFVARKFENGREMVEDELRSGHPPSVRTSRNIDHVRAFIRQDQRLTIRMIADGCNINECMLRQIATQNLNMRKVYAKVANYNQKVRQNELCA